ncbi:MAG: DUF6456 domain-containing protein [Rhodobacteraceae bacterium]|nr:DUF6456 domain-containing protein [Paracoccaceae bacterium]
MTDDTLTNSDTFTNLGPLTKALPDWVPEIAVTYLSHTTLGVPLRQIARQKGVHASTILRQVRKYEERREDPLVDQALDAAARELLPHKPEQKHMANTPTTNAEAKRILRHLSESGTYLLASKQMSKAAVFKEINGEERRKVATVETRIAHRFALQEWISGKQIGVVGRYTITSVGRAALRRMMAQDNGFTEQHQEFGERDIRLSEDGSIKRVRYNIAESPLSLLGRKRGANGAFLTAAQMAAGERLREDFELAHMGPRVAQNWDRFLTSASRGGFSGNTPAEGPSAARARVSKALSALGPGLADIVFRVCCFLDGLEKAEKRLGWSARSGKVVLRIALQRLAQHYGMNDSEETKMAG